MRRVGALVVLAAVLVASLPLAVAETCECQEPAPCKSHSSCSATVGSVCSPGSTRCTAEPGSELDTIPPFFDTNFPTQGSVTDTTISVNGQLNEPGTMYFVVLPTSAAAPSPAEVKAGTGAAGGGVLGAAAAVAGVGHITVSATVYGMTPLTTYSVYVVAQDGGTSPNLQTSVVTLSITTAPPGPKFVGGYPHLTDTTDTKTTLTVRITTEGFFYYAAVATGGAAPTSQQVKDMTVPNAEAAGFEPVPPGLVEVETRITGLEPETSYKIWVVAEDAQVPAVLQQNPIFLTQLTGEDATPPVMADNYPIVVSTLDTSVTLGVMMNEEGDVVYAVMEDGVAAPSYSALMGVVTNNPPALAVSSGIAAAPTRNTVNEFTATGLEASSSFHVYVVARDDHATPNVATTIQTTSFTTLDDISPPEFVTGWPAETASGERTIAAAAKMDEAGRMFAAVLPHGAVTPTPDELVATATAAGAGEIAATVFGFNQGPVSLGATLAVSASGLVEDTQYDVWFVAEDSADPPNRQTACSKVVVRTQPDATAPQFLVGYPSLYELSDLSFSIEARINEGGRAYAVVVPSGATKPSPEQVRAGAAPGTVLATATAEIAPGAGSNGILSISSGVVPSTTYDVYVTAEDDELQPNTMATATKVSVTTQTDATPPNWVGTAAVSDVQDFSVRFAAKIDEPGAVYYVVWPASDPVPSAAAVRKGEGPDGTYSVPAGVVNAPVPADGVTALINSGLTAASDLVIYLAAQDDEGQLPNLQPTLAVLPFTTLPDATPPLFQLSTPRLVDVQDFSMVLEVNTDEPSTVYFAALPGGTQAPTIAQLREQTFGVEAVVGTVDVPEPNRVVSHTIEDGVRHSTTYDVYVVAEDKEPTPNVQPVLRDLHATTLMDSRAPIWTLDPDAADVRDFSATIEFTVDEDATVYVLVRPSGTSTPTANAVVAAATVQVGVVGGVRTSFDLSQGIESSTPYVLFLVAVDTVPVPNVQPEPFVLTFTTQLDSTPPLFLPGYPTVTNITTTTLKINAVLNEPATMHYVIMDEGSLPLTAAQVINGITGPANGPAAAYGAHGTVKDNRIWVTVHQGAFEGLKIGRRYDVYIAAVDTANYNMQAEPVVISVKMQPDVVPPVFWPGFPKLLHDRKNGKAVVSVAVALNEPGQLYWMVTPIDADAPTVEQIRSGTYSFAYNFGVLEVPHPFVSASTIVSTGLDPDRLFNVYVTADDIAETPNSMGVFETIQMAVGQDDQQVSGQEDAGPIEPPPEDGGGSGGAIAAGILGALAFVGLVVLAGFMFVRWKQAREDAEDDVMWMDPSQMHEPAPADGPKKTRSFFQRALGGSGRGAGAGAGGGARGEDTVITSGGAWGSFYDNDKKGKSRRGRAGSRNSAQVSPASTPTMRTAKASSSKKSNKKRDKKKKKKKSARRSHDADSDDEATHLVTPRNTRRGTSRSSDGSAPSSVAGTWADVM